VGDRTATADGNSQDLGYTPESWCEVSAINKADEVVGWEWAGDIDSRAFVWSQGVISYIGTLPGDVEALALAINDRNEVVGASYGTAWHAFLWADGHMNFIGKSHEFFGSQALGINNDGEIVGSAHSKAPFNPMHAVRFVDGTVIDLESEVDNLADWRLKTATSINDAGVIVGWGRRSDGTHGFELVPR
jgi:probable HAF family extracellular repeat protein